MKFNPQPKDPEITPIDFAALEAIIHSTEAPPAPEAGSYKPTCVFLLLFNSENPHILAIQKAASDGYPWSDQVALPGGHLDADDAGPLACAFRELEEELRIRRSQVHLLGSLGHFQTIKNRDIEAFAGLWNGRGLIAPDPAEIARVLKIPLQLLIHTHLMRRFHNRIPDVKELRYPFKDVEVWGATARILHHFIELLFPLLENNGRPLSGSVQSD